MRPRLPALSIALCLGVVILGCEGRPFRAEEALPPRAEGGPSETYAVLINGGGSRTQNYQSHLLHVRELIELLVSRGIPERRITVFSSDGTDPAPDLAVRAPEPEENFWLIEDLDVGKRLASKTRYENSTFGRYHVYPANKAALETWFGAAAGSLVSGDTLLVYVTDHGRKNREDLTDNAIVLWGEELSVREFRDLLGRLPEGVSAVSLMSQCYSGSFANVIYDSDGAGEPDGSVCGYFSSTAERRAYGCYAENQGKFNVGHSFRFIEAMRRTPLFPEAHERVLVADQTPDVPNRTSDLYLERLLEHAAGERGVSVDEMKEQLLEVAWDDGAGSSGEVALLEEVSQAYGSLNTASIQELRRERSRLGQLRAKLSTYARRWSISLNDLKRENYSRFIQKNPEWRALLTPEVLDSLEASDRAGLRRDLLEALGEFTASDLTMQIRLETMRDRVAPVEAARYRMEVRQATVERLEKLLTRIAGRVHLETEASTEQQLAFEQIDSCESFSLAEPQRELETRLVEPEPFPPLSEDALLAERVAPGWVGINFRRARGAPGISYRGGPGAVLVEKVLGGGPAERAGIRTGDILLGPPGEHFTWSNEIREWIMLSPVHERRELELLRDGETLTVTIRTDPFPLKLPD
jgi:hypothetical protein